MRVAIASDWFAPRLGGIEAQLSSLAQRLGSRGHAVDVLTSTPAAAEGAGFRIRPLHVATIPRIQLAISPSLFPALRRELQRGYDVVHTHISVVSPVGYAAARIARSLGLPTVMTFHSVLKQKALLLAAANAIARLDRSAVVWSAVSDLVAGQVRAALRGVDVEILSNGIDVTFWRRAVSEVRVPNADPVTFVAVMRLQRKKRPRQLLRAFASAARHANAPVRLVIAGDGPEREVMERDLDRLGLRDGPVRTELIGWQSPSELRSLYSRAHAFLSASTRESFGIATLEARVAGLPIVAMRAAGSSEFLRDGEDALLCDSESMLVHAVIRLIQQPDLRRRLAGAIPAIDRYDWSVVLERHEAAYRRAMMRAAVAAKAVEE